MDDVQVQGRLETVPQQTERDAERTNVVKIVLVDDHAIVRQGLSSILDREQDLAVVGEASTPDEAIAVVARCLPSVVLLDLKLSSGADTEGLALCEQLTKQHEGLDVLVLTTFVHDNLVIDAIRRGARGYVVKDVDTTELVRAIHAVAKGENAFDSRAAAAMAHSINHQSSVPELTDREHNVLGLLARGLSNREIGGELYISETTVKFHVRNIMRKLTVSSRAECVYEATKLGLV
ncbi:MadR family response regulator transcription factor [Parasphingorhabdus pacifica]